MNVVTAMLKLEWSIQSELCAVNCLNGSFLGAVDLRIIEFCAGEDESVADLPTRDGFSECDGVIAPLRGPGQFHPRSTQRRTVEVHPAATTDDCGAGLLVEAVHVGKANQRREFCRDW